jgi:nitrogen regulatory protein P-II 1
MKEIRAIMQPHMLSKVMDALHRCEHFPGATVSDCQGQSRGRGRGGQYQATQETIFFAKKVRLDVLCSDEACDHLVDVIRKAAHTGNPGDGIIAVSDVGHVVRIRTTEEQDKAV